MSRSIFLLVLSLVIVVLAPNSDPVTAQGLAGENCPAVVGTALASVQDFCVGLGRNESCYGYNRVDALFWQPNDSLTFSRPADRVPLADLRSIATAPLDVENGLWGVAALHMHAPDLPEILPGQAVLFLLMGDTTLESAVSPQDIASPVMPVEGVTAAETLLYTIPDSAANTLGSVPGGTRLQLVGLAESGGWVEVLLTPGSHAWVQQASVTVEGAAALAALPMTYGENIPPRYGPMQAFYFTTGLAGPTCNEAPDALVVQTPSGMEVAFNINHLEIHIGSTVAFTTVAMPDRAGTRVLIAILFEGTMELTINGQVITLDTPGQAFGLTLNDEGLVDETSTFVRMTDEPLTSWVQNACRNAITSGLFDRLTTATACDVEMTYYTEEGFLAALHTPSVLPVLGQQQPRPPAAPPAPQPPAPPFQWPQITRPESQTVLKGGGGHQVIWTPTPGASSYQLDILPDSTNLTGYSASYTTTATQYDMPLDPMISRPHPGWGYFLRVIPLDANGSPMAPPDQAPMTWVVREDAPPTTPVPPPPPTEEPTEVPTEESMEEYYEY